MVTSRAQGQAGHARLHKRGHSASSSLASPLSPVADGGAFVFQRSETPRSTREESWASAHPLKIKPYLRKLSSKDANALDLSRPAAENESLAGLDIARDYARDYSAYAHDYSPSYARDYNPSYARSITDVTFTPVNGRHRHTRSTSNTSQFSTSSGGLTRPTPMPAIRPTPQPSTFLPPASQSSPSSLLDVEHEGDPILSDDELRQRQNAPEPRQRSGSLSSIPGVSLRINTNNSTTRLASTYSQSTISLTSPVAQARSRGDTLKSIDTTSPSSRTSLDQGLRFIRGGRDSPLDAASRAASIRAARAKFEEDELAKSRRYEKEASKQASRSHRRQAKLDSQRRKSEATDRAAEGSVSDARAEMTPRPSVGGRQYSEHREAHVNSLPKLVSTVDLEKVGVMPEVTTKRAAKGRWLSFVTWLKTRLLRLSRKVAT